MFFTIDDYRKIEKWLKANGVKDSDMPSAKEFTGEELITIVLNNSNKNLTVNKLMDELVPFLDNGTIITRMLADGNITWQKLDYNILDLHNTAVYMEEGNETITSPSTSQIGSNIFIDELNFELDESTGKAIIKLKKGSIDSSNLNDNLQEMIGATNVKKVGTYAERPKSVSKGFSYFCIDRHTNESDTNGIMIYWNGTYWVDALGRII